MKDEEGRKLLARLREHLKRQRMPISNLPVPWARKCAAAIGWYLSDRVKTLDAAFGQITPHRKADNAKKARIGRLAYKYRRDGLPWLRVYKVLAAKHSIRLDERTIRAYEREHRDSLPMQAHAEDILKDEGRGKRHGT